MPMFRDKEAKKISVKIIVDTSELDCAIEKTEKLSNNLYEIEKLMQDIFTQKSTSKCENKNDNALKKALFFETSACEKLKDKALYDYRQCFTLKGTTKVVGENLKHADEIYKRREAQFDILRRFLAINNLLEEYELFKKRDGI